MLLQVKNLCCAYGKKIVLAEVSFAASRGTVIGLLGPNGVGKTTLLKSLGGMIRPKSGSALVNGRDVSRMSAKERACLIGYVPQGSRGALPLRVVDMVMMGRAPHTRFSVKAEDRRIVFETLERLHLEKLAFRDINRLSGGERQRVLMARAIAQEPQLLLLDEPTSSLDMRHQLKAVDIIQDYVQTKSAAVVISIHDLNLAAMLCDYVLLFHQGGCLAQGGCDEVLTTERIRRVYDVEVEIGENHGRKHVFLVPPGQGSGSIGPGDDDRS
ncbi:MAG: ABC transporter ATP-binding protein [Spirochaetaceae bacterium]|jgi:iron complex transport system ATP-binding protein|nr:ABC transporter ATP-binding protein [Spirochaetaceae bacterium]